jgi:hypothetical protein
LIVAAWGSHGSYMGRGQQVAGFLREMGLEVYCLRFCKDGQPGHPLYVKKDTKLLKFL